jgi:hypothetical protein
MAREFLGQVRDTAGTTRVYRTANAFEADEIEGVSGIRRRIFFEDVFLVTYHRVVGTAFALILGGFCLLFLGLTISLLVAGLKVGGRESLIGAAVAGTLTAPLVVVFLNRLIRKKDIITIFGRHGRARLEFDWRKDKAKQVFRDVCKVARDSRPAVRRPRPIAPSLSDPPPAPSIDTAPTEA